MTTFPVHEDTDRQLLPPNDPQTAQEDDLRDLAADSQARGEKVVAADRVMPYTYHLPDYWVG